MKKYLHAKFHINNLLKSMDAFLLSEDENRVDVWKADEDDDTSSEIATSAQPNTFPAISKAFEQSMEEFQETVPFMMTMVPLILQLSDDRKIRCFVKRNGDLLNQTDDYETYRIGIDRFDEKNTRLRQSQCIHSGIRSLPGMFL
jgi:hypothetical protein